MNLVYKKICPICDNKLIRENRFYSCPTGCYKLYDYFQVYDIAVFIPFGKVLFVIHKGMILPTTCKTFVYNKEQQIIFIKDYLVPIDFNDIPKFINRIKTLIVFS